MIIRSNYFRRSCCIVNTLMHLAITVIFSLLFLLGNSFCLASDSKYELEFDYMTAVHYDRDIDTVSLHILKKVSETSSQSRTFYRGVTLTRPWGDIIDHGKKKNSDSFGAGPIYMIRYQKKISEKFSGVLDISGGLILYTDKFPAGGEHYNFMWRIGPKFVYKFNENSSMNIGYMWMHVSNGLHGSNNNPSYDSNGVSLGIDVKF